jgi:hypothetical protein
MHFLLRDPKLSLLVNPALVRGEVNEEFDLRILEIEVFNPT